MRGRILYGSPHGPFRCWLGEEGGTDRIILLTRRSTRQFYLSVRAFGLRLRLHSNYPWVWFGRA